MGTGDRPPPSPPHPHTLTPPHVLEIRSFCCHLLPRLTRQPPKTSGKYLKARQCKPNNRVSQIYHFRLGWGFLFFCSFNKKASQLIVCVILILNDTFGRWWTSFINKDTSISCPSLMRLKIEIPSTHYPWLASSDAKLTKTLPSLRFTGGRKVLILYEPRYEIRCVLNKKKKRKKKKKKKKGEAANQRLCFLSHG